VSVEFSTLGGAIRTSNDGSCESSQRLLVLSTFIHLLAQLGCKSAAPSKHILRFANTYQLHNGNNGQRKRYKRRFANVSVTPGPGYHQMVVYIVFFGHYFHYKAVEHF